MSSSSEAVIRPAGPDDYAGVSRLLDMVDDFHRDRLPWMFKSPDAPARSEAHFADLLKRDDAAVFVADAGLVAGVAVGVMRAAPGFPGFVHSRWGVLDMLAVDPAWRRRGIGRSLARSVEAWAIGAGAPWVEVNVYEVNPEARRFYEELGYLPLSAKLRIPGPPRTI